MLRPRPARWFEILAARDDATLALEALARTGAVELEARASAGLPPALADVRPLLEQFHALETRHHAYWPTSGLAPSRFPEAPARTLARCLERIRAWCADAEPVIATLQRLEAERSSLVHWRGVLGALADAALDVGLLARAGPCVQAALFTLPVHAQLPAPEGALVRRVELDGGAHLLVVAPPAELEAIAMHAGTLHGRRLAVPDWLGADVDENLRALDARLAAIDRDAQALRETLQGLHRAHDLHRCLGDAGRLQWVIRNVHALEEGDLFCWITGWSSDRDGVRLARALEHSGARALLHFPRPPAAAKAPMLLDNPWWARPFEIFGRALGVPSASEADPSPLLAVAVPLMFGYMFGDVGQGLVLALAGAWLRRRFVVARLLMIGGVAAAVFGALFGSVFGLHALVPALWLNPLDDPLRVLVVPILAGAVLLALGLVLAGVQAFWRGELAGWLASEAATIVVYLGVLSSFAHPGGAWAAIAGAAWYCAGRAIVARRAGALLPAAGELVERTLQILINTLSFARVGAFALAHAGLSSAIVALVDAADAVPARALVLVGGNALVIALEAMVVSIQTTRLVLFEFFTRFMAAEGRAFRPLPAPPFTSQES